MSSAVVYFKCHLEVALCHCVRGSNVMLIVCANRKANKKLNILEDSRLLSFRDKLAVFIAPFVITYMKFLCFDSLVPQS